MNSTRHINSLSKAFLLLIFSGLSQAAFAQCEDGCVWPGDLNNNGVVNAIDILSFGFSIGETGPLRPAADINWFEQAAEDWGQSTPPLGADLKHVDANGDGIINFDDNVPVSFNLGLTNDDFSGTIGNDIEGEELFIVPQNTSTGPGGTLVFDIHLGTEDNPVENVYGLAFDIEQDYENVEDMTFSYDDSWLNTEEDNFYGWGKLKDELGINQAGFAETRLDGTSVSGFGLIGRIEIVITDVILGLEVDSTACVPFPIRFKNVLAVDAEGNDLMVGTKTQEFLLKKSDLTSVDTPRLPRKIKVSPNPTSDLVRIESENAQIEELVLLNKFGQVVLLEKGQDTTMRLHLKNYHLPTGLYFLQIKTSEGMETRSLILK